MKENIVIAQLRGTIFAPINIGYTPENNKAFSEMLLPGAKAYSANTPDMLVPGMNPAIPQYGLPWRLFKKCDEGDFNIVFLPGKIDIILTKDVPYGGDCEESFCAKCVEWFRKILGTQEQGIVVNRIAYAPLYAIKLDSISADTVWGRMLKNTMVDGTPLQDINLSYLIKRQVGFDGRGIQLNLLHNFTDGMQVKQEGDTQTAYRVVLLQLDINSIPEVPLSLDSAGVKSFFDGIIVVKNDLIDNVAE